MSTIQGGVAPFRSIAGYRTASLFFDLATWRVQRLLHGKDICTPFHQKESP
jgi:hypothetical protein